MWQGKLALNTITCVVLTAIQLIRSIAPVGNRTSFPHTSSQFAIPTELLRWSRYLHHDSGWKISLRDIIVYTRIYIYIYIYIYMWTFSVQLPSRKCNIIIPVLITFIQRWRSRDCECEDYCVLGRDAVQSGKFLPKFRRNILPPSSG
jgi:hypothetical protein